MFRVFGHDRIWVLDGGLPRWRASGYDVESSASGDAILKASAASEAIEKVYQGQAVSFLHPPLSNLSCPMLQVVSLIKSNFFLFLSFVFYVGWATYIPDKVSATSRVDS